ncbi:ABC transporter permease [Schnuerera ultunensis]|uniref:ABC transporter permease n=1 Tax=Schnuerera ultunensis TaxID=45497 RepID=UPI0004275107|nr:ABC transporter permease [Schnuerera ultunensis]
MERIKNDRNKRELILGLFTFAAFMVLYIFTNFKTAAGTMMGLCGYTAAYLSQKGFNFLVFIPAAIIVGVLFASINGILITKFKVPAMVATLAMVNVHLGIFILLPHGGWVENLQSNFTKIGRTSFFTAIPLVFVLSLILTAILLWFMKYSRFSKKIYAVGGNAEAAILSGIQPEKVIMQTYILEGILIGIASVLFYTPKSIVQANSTHGMEMLFITATVVGGTNIAGGEDLV